MGDFVGLDIVMHFALCCQKNFGRLDVATAEAMAVLYGLELASATGLQVESDSLSAIKGLQGKLAGSPYQGLFIDDAISLSSQLRSISFCNVKRAVNSLAHALSKFGLSTEEDHVWMEDIPSFLVPIAVSDMNTGS